MIVDKITQWDRVIVYEYGALRPSISVVFRISAKKLQMEDTEAGQKKMRMTYETFCEV